MNEVDNGSVSASAAVRGNDQGQGSPEQLGTYRVAAAADTERQGKLYAALALAQGAFAAIAKNRKVRITMKSGGSYEFRYADLEAILAAVRPALSANGLAVVQTLEQYGAADTHLVTQLVHSAGGRLISDIKLPRPSDSDPKAFGATITYFRRYTLSALIGVAADDDLDEDGEEIKSEDDKRAAELSALLKPARAAAAKGTAAYEAHWGSLSKEDKKTLVNFHAGLKKQAAEVTKAQTPAEPADAPADASAGS